MSFRYDVLSILGGELAKNVTLDTAFALLKGYELINPMMVSHIKLVAAPVKNEEPKQVSQTAAASSNSPISTLVNMMGSAGFDPSDL